MQLDVEREVAALERMTVGQLRERFGEVFGEQTNARHKQWLIKRIAWKMQANIEGDISERARRRAAELSKAAPSRSPTSSTELQWTAMFQPLASCALKLIPALTARHSRTCCML
jgi:hypothetical protein